MLYFEDLRDSVETALAITKRNDFLDFIKLLKTYGEDGKLAESILVDDLDDTFCSYLAMKSISGIRGNGGEEYLESVLEIFIARAKIDLISYINRPELEMPEFLGMVSAFVSDSTDTFKIKFDFMSFRELSILWKIPQEDVADMIFSTAKTRDRIVYFSDDLLVIPNELAHEISKNIPSFKMSKLPII